MCKNNKLFILITVLNMLKLISLPLLGCMGIQEKQQPMLELLLGLCDLRCQQRTPFLQDFQNWSLIKESVTATA